MPRISNIKKEKISEHILSVLYDQFPKPLFTSNIASEIARDEEFTKKLLSDLKEKQLVIMIDRNTLGSKYIRRARWRLSNKAQEAYTNHTNTHNNQNKFTNTFSQQP